MSAWRILGPMAFGRQVIVEDNYNPMASPGQVNVEDNYKNDYNNRLVSVVEEDENDVDNDCSSEMAVSSVSGDADMDTNSLPGSSNSASSPTVSPASSFSTT